MDELVLDRVCPFCNEDIKAHPRKVVNQVGWSDSNGVRTNRVSIEFEAVHQCGALPAPVEKSIFPSTIQDTLDELHRLSTPKEGPPPPDVTLHIEGYTKSGKHIIT